MMSASICLALVSILLLTPVTALCGDEYGFEHLMSDSIAPALVIGEVALYCEGGEGRNAAFRGAEALLLTTLVVQGLKDTVRESRPNNESDLRSFPSGHTASAFTLATIYADHHPESAWIVYTGAALVGWSRVELNDHYWHDVLAGALIGHLIAKRVDGSRLFGLTPEGTVGLHFKF